MKNSWEKILHKSLVTNDRNLFKKIPHTDLHCHSITSAPFSAFIKLSPKIKAPPKQFKNIKDFNLFLRNNIAPLIKDLNTIRYLLRETFHRLINEGVIYTEMSFDLTIPEYLGVTMKEYLEMIKDEKKRIANKLKVCVEAGLDREIEPHKLYQLFKESLKNNIFGSVDLYGDESANPIDSYINIYKIAKKNNLKLKAHVGETGTSDDIKEAIQKLRLESIQHGISAIQDDKLIEILTKNNISLNICPSSNISLGYVKEISKHPIKKLLDKGVSITVNSDDFSMFGKSVGDELLELYKNHIFSEKEIINIICNGLKQIK